MDNTVFGQQQQQKKPKMYQNDSILESLRAIGGGVGKAVAKDVTGKIASDALASLFGAPPPAGGELRANRSMDFQKERQPFSPFRRPEIHRPPIVELGEPNLKREIEEVRAELKALSMSMRNLNTEIQKAVNEVPIRPGVYHKNFLDRLRSIMKVLREQIEDSRSWLVMHNARKQKKGYWGLYKKHGTQFGLSTERTMATSAG
ncbi:hypothetical protein A2Z00_00540 [Candidatus Gottesmanbacteria bacterium RBG_13_45_10]|uniref:DUF5660 domain-containing protein n=1 Tax=Candidatus Gottesmanbacteria bacterium RBG_13_45_10 TaxID=1798370 RepID=A0A1F5ZGG6_9BACT|nr:MAG: hypothetical protein A2Z00_00540 [Candidatus Gottesmanbacteria bacterium RBG_13_45_10]